MDEFWSFVGSPVQRSGFEPDQVLRKKCCGLVELLLQSAAVSIELLDGPGVDTQRWERFAVDVNHPVPAQMRTLTKARDHWRVQQIGTRTLYTRELKKQNRKRLGHVDQIWIEPMISSIGQFNVETSAINLEGNPIFNGLQNAAGCSVIRERTNVALECTARAAVVGNIARDELRIVGQTPAPLWAAPKRGTGRKRQPFSIASMFRGKQQERPSVVAAR